MDVLGWTRGCNGDSVYRCGPPGWEGLGNQSRLRLHARAMRLASSLLRVGSVTLDAVLGRWFDLTEVSAG